ncbi:MAG: DUF120 domain-containing protein [Ignisphaera sp.]|uniref:Riboflavin kinase n=1 Tax=Ignisphaera aggregans TaxID=334771 RepID=A0A7J3MZL6_9CREN
MVEKPCDDSYIIIKGKVIDGLGEGARYVQLYSNNISRVLGIKPYPGTLNILVDREYTKIIELVFSVDKPMYTLPPPMEGFGKVYVWKAYIDCLQVYIVRPEITLYSSQVLEIISNVFLRKTLGKRSGDSIDIVVTHSGIAPCFCL